MVGDGTSHTCQKLSEILKPALKEQEK